MISSYKKIECTGKFRGYITNIYDPANYDIDIQFDEDTKSKYQHVFKSLYTAIDLDDTPPISPKRLESYRCRVKGVTIIRPNYKNNKPIDYPMKNATTDINKKVFLFNSWVDCDVSDIDFYNRILVKLYDPITGESLTDDVFDKYPTLFSKYVKYDD